MKRALYLCAVIGAVFILDGCANQGTTTRTTTTTTHQGLVGPGSVAPIGGGPAGPLANKQVNQP